MKSTTKKFVGKALLSGGVALVGLGLASGTAQAFDPQPDPPGKPVAVAVNPPILDKSATVGFNPQPEPPTRWRVSAQG
ncbi:MULTISPECIES: hypothetical protein [unclassified Mycobacterium]|uniref:hypothetical protein n=1 Tax=unclassified Mycobacterium TaxID=2642494 RepID=UPI0029C68A83|nr:MULTISPECIES: hypothetical protein [unclassified Mycobacterium]